MGRKHYTAEQIIGMLREAEVLQSQGMTIGEASRWPTHTYLGHNRRIHSRVFISTCGQKDQASGCLGSAV